jgi:hypothetical protein
MFLYINGKQAGNTTYQYPQRRYTVPADLLKAGKNIFVIRVTNTAGKGGFVPDKPYCIFAGNDTIDLKVIGNTKLVRSIHQEVAALVVASLLKINQPLYIMQWLLRSSITPLKVFYGTRVKQIQIVPKSMQNCSLHKL